MAVIEGVGCTVQICVDEKPLPEFDDPEPDAKELSTDATTICNKYIQAQDDAQFSIRVECRNTLAWLSENPNNALRFRPYIDGQSIDGVIVVSREFVDGSQKFTMDKVTVEVGRGGYRRIRKFSFASIGTVDDGDLKRVSRDVKRAKGLGNVRVEVFRAIATHERPAKTVKAVRSTISIAEKALKGQSVSHGTKFGVEETRRLSSRLHSKGVDCHPIAIFNFKYRSGDALRDEMVIPRTPSPDLEAERVAAMSIEELQRFALERMRDDKDRGPVKREDNRRNK